MNKETNVLIIVEGKRAEPKFFEQIKKVYDLTFDIYCLETNIYLLYRRMKEVDFNGDVKNILLALHPEYAEMLDKKFAYTYLFFDFDPHHTEEYEKDIPIDTIVSNNILKLREMASFFVDETDPTIGKLYINYPMLESYKDCDSFFDNNYMNAYVNLCDIKKYKEHVGTKKLANKRIDSYEQVHFQMLSKMNLFKLNHILYDKWEAMAYSDYCKICDASTILSAESNIVKHKHQIAVLNTSLFFLIDYYGNRDGFYENTIT